MKRTRYIHLDSFRKANKPHSISFKPAALGVMAATLSACGDTEVANIYTSVAECGEDNPDFVELCEVAYQEALEEALEEATETAPQYAQEQDCEADFGFQSCMPNYASGNNWFMPVMAGFMFAQILDVDDFNLKKKKKKRYYSPLFMSKSRRSPVFGNWVGAAGTTYSAFHSRKINVPKTAFNPKPKATKTTRRGGFGSMVRSMSSSRSWGS